ncbi:nuclear envelope integral membrane protein isoform X2 [Hylaeus anthracinus]|uniref:nuclear envelope integral membrane protein isoform X2 n=1 Tax=Hylaeus volcanicus TaxID=313075 RepID=UPI0023B829B8|nr:nuclear envelope integral membrane protein isoform X2 [Hylaeus volcanicus]XP_054015582.1 nuclear envelope integral membrane protein isoform X2 [Hylaeus anthracinus]
MGYRIVQSFSVITCLLFLNYFLTESASTSESIHFLKPGDVVTNDKPGLQIFCHSANTKYVIHLWRSLTMHLNINIDNYDLYDGKNQQEVVEKHDDNQRSWRFNLFGTKRSNKLKINPFEDMCVGVYVYPSHVHKYTMSMTQTRVDIWKLMLTILGITIYWNAYKLSGNPLFYYLSGIMLGITTSIIILVYFASKLLPRGKVMYLMVATGWTMSFYLLQGLWENAHLIAVQYKEYVVWYILGTSLISFVICYRFGPVTNPRTKKLIEWFLQIGGLIAIYYSSYFREASFFCCIVMVLLYNFPIILIRKGKNYWFAKFMEGESHLSDDESRDHDAEITRIIEECEYTDDEDDY